MIDHAKVRELYDKISETCHGYKLAEVMTAIGTLAGDALFAMQPDLPLEVLHDGVDSFTGDIKIYIDKMWTLQHAQGTPS